MRPIEASVSPFFTLIVAGRCSIGTGAGALADGCGVTTFGASAGGATGAVGFGAEGAGA